MVDEVKEVVNLAEDSIDHKNTSENGNSYIFGVGKHADGLISLMNIQAVLAEKEDQAK